MFWNTGSLFHTKHVENIAGILKPCKNRADLIRFNFFPELFLLGWTPART